MPYLPTQFRGLIILPLIPSTIRYKYFKSQYFPFLWRQDASQEFQICSIADLITPPEVLAIPPKFRDMRQDVSSPITPLQSLTSSTATAIGAIRSITTHGHIPMLVLLASSKLHTGKLLLHRPLQTPAVLTITTIVSQLDGLGSP